MRLLNTCKILSVLVLSISLLSPASANTIQEKSSTKEQVFARINQRTISYDEFMQIFHTAVRYKYYHGKVPQKELQAFQRKVGKDVVEQVLLYQQALKLGLVPDNKSIQAGLAEYDNKYNDKQAWQEQKQKNMSQLLDRLERQNLIEQMQLKIRDIKQPDFLAVKQFYKNNSSKFTEPKRAWLSVILLSVPPSSAEKTWQEAEKAAQQFISEINQGQSFYSIAQQFSAHPSAVNGGDLGYLHQGMLEGDAKKVVDIMSKDEISKPVRVLEGVILFRLNGTQPAKLMAFEKVKTRAKNLLYRQLQDQAWNEYLIKLNQSADVFINKKLYASIDTE